VGRVTIFERDEPESTNSKSHTLGAVTGNTNPYILYRQLETSTESVKQVQYCDRSVIFINT